MKRRGEWLSLFDFCERHGTSAPIVDRCVELGIVEKREADRWSARYRMVDDADEGRFAEIDAEVRLGGRLPEDGEDG